MLGKTNQNSQPKTYSGENGQSIFKPKQWDQKNGRQNYKENQIRATLNGQMVPNQNSSNDKRRIQGAEIDDQR